MPEPMSASRLQLTELFHSFIGAMGRAAPSLRAKCLAEFLGTFLLVLTVECNVTIGAVNYSLRSSGLGATRVLLEPAYVKGRAFPLVT